MNTENKCGDLNKVKLTGNILFSGIGAQERGFEDSGLFKIEVLTTSDICKEAVLSYAAIHCGLTNEMVENYQDYPTREEMAQHLTDINLGYEPDKNKYYDWFKKAKKKNKELEKYWLACKLSNNLGDISKIEELPYADFWTVSFCCQDISVAGKMKGLKPDSGTRSSLLWDNIKLLEKARTKGTLPKYLMFENVKNLVSKKFINDFNDLIEVLDELGFNTYWKIINGKDCGIPQNRERVFVIAIRKDIDTEEFEFPKPFDNGLRLKDILDNTVDEKYYITDDKVSRFVTSLNKKDALMYDVCQAKREGKAREYNEFSPTITSRDYKDPRIINENIVRQVGTISECNGSWKNPQVGRIYSPDGCSPTINTCGGGSHEPKIFDSVKIRIRKLIPKECWRLMGFRDSDCDAASKIGVADSHLYKQAGNSIITNCVRLLAEHLYKAQYDNTYMCTDENFTQPQVD